MPISVLLDPTQFPNLQQDQKTFDAAWAGVLRAIPQWGAQANALAASLNILAAGGAYAIPYTVIAAANADTDPGPGRINFTAVSQNATGVLRLNILGVDGIDYSSLLDTFDSSTSAVKGTLRIVKQNDPSKYLIFNVTSRTAPGGYRNIYVTPVASSAASPFAITDVVLVFFQRTGDKGDVGTAVQVFHAREEQAAGTAGGVSSYSSNVAARLSMNTVKQNDFGATLTGGRFILPAGKYIIRARAPYASYVNYQSIASHTTIIVNNTANAIVGVGTKATVNNTGNNNVICDYGTSEAVAYVSLGASATFQINTISAASPSSGGTAGPTGTGAPEVYVEIFVEKIG